MKNSMNKVQLKVESTGNPAIGVFYLVASEEGLHGLFWKPQAVPLIRDREAAAHLILKKTLIQLEEYFEGKRKTFDLPLRPEGTEFQKRVWRELSKIPYGETRSYRQIARALNDPNASRAVGTANGRNPISIIVPCHRVITSDGRLGGYAGGLAVKECLLGLEGVHSLER